MKVLVRSFSLLALCASLYAECKVDYSIMYFIAENERHPKKGVGYPFLISFNKASDAKKARQNLDLKWLDKRTVDCKSIDNCKNELADINSMDITNLDLGGFQINQNSFFYEDSEDYFNLRKSYLNACNIVYRHYQETKDWSWKTIARYHSKTPSHNKPYAKGLEKKYIKSKKQKG